jgi:peptidoglycan/LPS O-acetylase OafA/YrhL
MNTISARLPNQPNAPADSPVRITALDGIRGIAVLLVIIVHSDGYFGGAFASGYIAGPLAIVFGAGWVGVNLFFVLSGFLITGILFDVKWADNYYRAFYARRALRILPLYFGYVSLISIIAFWKSRTPGAEHLGRGDISSLFGFYYNFRVAMFTKAELPNVHHLWSLCVEEHFYLLWPIIILSLPRRRVMQLCVAGMFIALGLRIAVAASGAWPQIAYILTPCEVDGLLAGSFVALMERGQNARDHFSRFARPVMAGSGLILFAILVVQHHFYNFNGPGVDPRLDLTLGITALSIFFAALLASLLHRSQRSPLGRFLERNWLVAIGHYSYAMYVFHFIILSAAVHLLFHFVPSAASLPDYETKPLLAVFGVIASFAAAWVSYNLFEIHFLRLKSHFTISQAGWPEATKSLEVMSNTALR